MVATDNLDIYRLDSLFRTPASFQSFQARDFFGTKPSDKKMPTHFFGHPRGVCILDRSTAALSKYVI